MLRVALSFQCSVQEKLAIGLATGIQSRGIPGCSWNSKDSAILQADLLECSMQINPYVLLRNPAPLQVECDRNTMISLPRSFFQDLMSDLASAITSSSVLCFLSAFTDMPMRVDCKRTLTWIIPEQIRYLLLTGIRNNHNTGKATTEICSIRAFSRVIRSFQLWKEMTDSGLLKLMPSEACHHPQTPPPHTWK